MPRGERGFALLWVLFLIVLIGLALTKVTHVWQTELRREREVDLLFYGDLFRTAIERFHNASPGGVKHYPTRLADLLEDPRFPNTVRYLPRIYLDPFSHGADWGLVKRDGEIVGVYSLAPGVPMKTADFPQADAAFDGATSYADWRFVAPSAEVKPAPQSGKTNK